MDQEAVSMLQLVKEPIGIVAVCGRARQGKSFILNQVRFLGFSSLNFCGHVLIIVLLLFSLCELNSRVYDCKAL